MTMTQHQQNQSEQVPVLSNTDAEQSVLGVCMMDDIYPTLNIGKTDFYIHRHRFIWAAFEKLHGDGYAIDTITVVDELERQKTLHEIGGPAYINQLVASVMSFSAIQSHAKLIKELASKRNQIEIANSIAHGAWNGGVDIANVIERLSETSNATRQGRMAKHGLVDLYDEVEERAKNPIDVWGIPTGFIDFDNMTGGLHKQQTVIIPGSPGAGKTTWMLQAALHAAESGFGVAIFEAEMDEARALRRLIELKYRIPNRAMVTGRMDGHWSTFTAAVDELSNLPIYINDDPTIDTAKMRGEIARLKSRVKVDLVGLDYVNLLTDIAGSGNDNYQNTAIKAKRFRSVCREMNVAGLTIQSITKDGMKSLVPHLADMSGPAEVAFGADQVWFLVQDPDKKNMYELVPAKQRDGDRGSGSVSLIRKGLGFENATHRDETMYPGNK